MGVLDQFPEWNAYEQLKPRNAGKKPVYALAEELAKDINLQPGDDLEPIVEATGGKIHFLYLDELDKVDGSIFIHKPGNFDIILPVFTGPCRDRFTIAHELGHYVLHTPSIKSKAARSSESGPLEWEANWFAAGLLMPTESFREYNKKYKGDTAKLAARFGVSREAATIRLECLEKHGF